MSDKLTSRVQWSASLDPTKAQVPTEETKFHRKVCSDRLFFVRHNDSWPHLCVRAL